MEKEIRYAGKICVLAYTYDEETEPKWYNKAQYMIDNNRKNNIASCCIHNGNLHGYYEEKVVE